MNNFIKGFDPPGSNQLQYASPKQKEVEQFLSIFNIPENSGIRYYPERNQFLTKIDLWKVFAKGMTDALAGWQACLEYTKENKDE